MSGVMSTTGWMDRSRSGALLLSGVSLNAGVAQADSGFRRDRTPPNSRPMRSRISGGP